MSFATSGCFSMTCLVMALSSLQVNVFIGDLDAATDGNNMTGDASIGSLQNDHLALFAEPGAVNGDRKPSARSCSSALWAWTKNASRSLDRSRVESRHLPSTRHCRGGNFT